MSEYRGVLTSDLASVPVVNKRIDMSTVWKNFGNTETASVRLLSEKVMEVLSVWIFDRACEGSNGIFEESNRACKRNSDSCVILRVTAIMKIWFAYWVQLVLK